MPEPSVVGAVYTQPQEIRDGASLRQINPYGTLLDVPQYIETGIPQNPTTITPPIVPATPDTTIVGKYPTNCNPMDYQNSGVVIKFECNPQLSNNVETKIGQAQDAQQNASLVTGGAGNTGISNWIVIAAVAGLALIMIIGRK